MKLHRVLTVLGTTGIVVNMAGIIVNWMNTFKPGGCFLCKIDHASSLDGKVMNLFVGFSLLTVVFLVIILAGYILRKSYDKKD